MAASKLVRCIVPCAGMWGSIQFNQVVNLPVDIAQSLLRAGYVVEVDKDGVEVVKKKGPQRKWPAANAS